jgi:hypothetical protein
MKHLYYWVLNFVPERCALLASPSLWLCDFFFIHMCIQGLGHFSPLDVIFKLHSWTSPGTLSHFIEHCLSYCPGLLPAAAGCCMRSGTQDILKGGCPVHITTQLGHFGLVTKSCWVCLPFREVALWSECCGLPLSQFLRWNPNLQGDGIMRWGLGEVIRPWGIGALTNVISALTEEASGNFFSPLAKWGHREISGIVTKSVSAWFSDSSLQSFRQQSSGVYKPPSL